MEFPRKNSVLDNFPSIFPLPNTLQNANSVNILFFLGSSMTIKFGKFGNFAHFIVRNFVASEKMDISSRIYA